MATCFVCTEDEQCALACLEGVLIAVYEHQHDGQHGPYWTGTLLLRPARYRAAVRVEVGPQWSHLIHDLALLSSRWSRLSGDEADRPVIRCYHLDHTLRQGARERWRTLPGSLLVIEPDRLVDVSRLEGTAYCLRQWMAQQLSRDEHNEAMVRGTAVHACFEHQAVTGGPASAALAAVLRDQTLPLALLQRSHADLAEAMAPHLTRLDLWYEAQGKAQLVPYAEQPRRKVRCETLLLCPELGLRGRIDLAVTGDSINGAARPAVGMILELKTGKANPNYPDPQFQVQGYHAILQAQRRRAPGQQAWVIYTGALTYDIQRVDFSPGALKEVVQRRNMVVLAERWDHAPVTGTERQCARSGRRAACRDVGFLLELGPCQGCRDAEQATTAFNSADRAFYAHYYRLLRRESAEAGRAVTALWQQEPAVRVAAGAALWIQGQVEPPQQVDGSTTARWQYRLSCHNESELRPGDRVLLSDGDPVRGEVIGGIVQLVAKTEIVVSAADCLDTPPQLVDRYETQEPVERALSALFTWLSGTSPEARALVYGTRAPQFAEATEHEEAKTPSVSLNATQAEAVRCALTMRDYLLIQGPPGTGKTTVIAQIVAALVARGERVLLSAWTNRAVDTMLHGLLAAGMTKFARLGSPVAVDPTIREGYLVGWVTEGRDAPDPGEVAHLLATVPVLAATATTWADGRYGRSLFSCDVAIVDEAAQATVPAVLGPLRLAQRFILVGDDRQLPAVVSCAEARDELGRSLFERLRPVAQEHGALITLHEQYRMNEAICAFPSTAFYDGALAPHPTAAGRRVAYTGEHRALATPHVRRLLDPALGMALVDVRRPVEDRARRENQHEAAVVGQIVEALCALGINPRDIGVVAPYRAQVALVRRHLETTAFTQEIDGLTVDTVDRFQGGERDVILLSLVSSASGRQVGSGHAEFLSDPRRLNVALTRARAKLIVIGDLRVLSWLPVLRDLVTHCHAAGTIVRWPRHATTAKLPSPPWLSEAT